MTGAEARSLGTNWAGNYEYRAGRLHRPTTIEQVRDIVANAASVRVLGSRHSFSDIADAVELVSLDAMTGDAADVVIDHHAQTVSFGAGLTYGELVESLNAEGVALHNLASLPHISVAGAVATASHGSGFSNGNLATVVAALQIVTSGGDVVTASRGDPDFDGLVVGLGAIGAVTRITLDVQPSFDVRQRVFEGLSAESLDERFDDVMSCGYSVSVFTRWGDTHDQVWVKSRTDEPEQVADDLFGAAPATVERHPILELDPTSCTPQLGRPGRWSDRLPHFRMGFTPSAGEELQSEYLLPRRHAAEAIAAVRALAGTFLPILQVCEIRTVAADRLWMSTSYGEASVAIHFTWKREPAAVEEALLRVEGALAPFGARPHWGKLFHADAATIAGLYEHHADFVRLVERLDPRGAFRNAWLRTRVLGAS